LRLQSEKGFSLIEVMMSIALIAIVGVAFLSTLSGASKILFKTDNSAIAQMEQIKSSAYKLNTYDVDTSLFNSSNGYTANITVNSIKPDGSLQKITISVYQGSDSNPVYVLTNYKTR
jgi:prepilin-type N-terminal cleavage/methylation domain-containing protein